MRARGLLLCAALTAAFAGTALAAEGSRYPRYFAQITPFQQKMIETWVAPDQAPEEVRPTLAAAAPEIRKFLATVSCKADFSKEAVSVSPAERTPYNDSGPMADLNTHEHRYTVCLTVDRIRNWKRPKEDAVAFEVIYRSPDTLETVEKNYLAERQHDGSWRFSYALREKR